jgi:hypothetical protein
MESLPVVVRGSIEAILNQSFSRENSPFIEGEGREVNSGLVRGFNAKT